MTEEQRKTGDGREEQAADEAEGGREVEEERSPLILAVVAKCSCGGTVAVGLGESYPQGDGGTGECSKCERVYWIGIDAPTIALLSDHELPPLWDVFREEAQQRGDHG